MPLTLPNLYCTPNDIYGQVGIEAAQLRLDDQNQASGQQISTTGGIIGATSLPVAALQYPLLAGTRLAFSDGGMDTPVEVTLTGVAAVGATTISITPLAVAVASGAIAIDNGVNVWLAGLMIKACQIATARVKLYCLSRYEDNQLVLSWSVNQWAITIASRWLGTRLFRAAPEQSQSAYEEVMEELKAVKASELNIEDIGTRTSGWPWMSNLTVDLGFTVRRIRVEPSISEPTPTQYAQAVDWNSYFLFEF